MVGQLCVSLPSSTVFTDLSKPCLAIHGDKQQNERDWVLNEFKTGKSPIMVATDVASRGIGMIDHQSALPFPPPPSIDVVWLRCVKLCSLQMFALQLLLSGPGSS